MHKPENRIFYGIEAGLTEALEDYKSWLAIFSGFSLENSENSGEKYSFAEMISFLYQKKNIHKIPTASLFPQPRFSMLSMVFSLLLNLS